MGFTKPIEQILLSYQGTINVSEIYYTRRVTYEGIKMYDMRQYCHSIK